MFHCISATRLRIWKKKQKIKAKKNNSLNDRPEHINHTRNGRAMWGTARRAFAVGRLTDARCSLKCTIIKCLLSASIALPPIHWRCFMIISIDCCVTAIAPLFPFNCCTYSASGRCAYILWPSSGNLPNGAGAMDQQQRKKKQFQCTANTDHAPLSGRQSTDTLDSISLSPTYSIINGKISNYYRTKYMTYLFDCTGGVAYGTPRNASIGRRNL